MDQEFIQSAIHSAIKTKEDGDDEVEEEKKEPTDSSKNDTKPVVVTAGMTAEDAVCYAKRYSDLGGKPAQQHYAEIGEKEGRNPYCAPQLTQLQALRYAWRYADVNNQTNYRNERLVGKTAKEHYRTIGFKEKRDMTPVKGFESDKCAD